MKTSAKTLFLRDDDDDDAGHSRNSKKSKNGLNVMEEEEWPKLGGVMNNSWQHGQSFAEKLKGINDKGEGNACEAQGNDMANLEIAPDSKEHPPMENLDTWKVVQKPRRQHQGSREKQHGDFRQRGGGSRFDILAEDGDAAVGGKANPVLQVVQFRVEAKTDLQSMTTGNSLKDQRKEKRLREGIQKEKESIENAESTYGTSKGEENQSADLMEDKNEVDVSEPLQDVAICDAGELIHSSDPGLPLLMPPEPGDSDRLGVLQGKFWNGPNELGLNVEMEDDIEEDSPSGIKAGYRSVNPSILILTETKCEQESKFHCLSRLGFDDYAFVPSNGRSGDLIMSWKSNRVGVAVLQTDHQFIHIRCSPVGMSEFLLTAVYAIPNPILKASLWRELRRLSSLISAPWVLIAI
ncbi:hypothetical protein K1719_027280 [Acacia pycnantha]|nr:hypothetical protein K1719_027280 [Acacia pycnantha]